MGDLTRNFSRSEFACPCCGRADVDMRLVEALQELRDLAGVPVRVNSGFRCEKHNREVGGARRSRHLLGEAADIVVKGLTPERMYRLAEQVEAFRNGGIGLYPQQLDGRYVNISSKCEVRSAKLKEETKRRSS